MKLESYWLATAPAFEPVPPQPLPATADIVVVGAGFTGLSAALSFARAGADVVVLDAGDVIGQASGRNGGHCNTGVAQDFASLVAGIGVERASLYHHTYTHAVDYVEQVVREQAIDCDFQRTAKLKLASKPSHFAKMAASHEALRTLVGARSTLLSAADIRHEAESDAFHGGLLLDGGGEMHMGRFGRGLAQAAQRHGARIYTHHAVTSLKRLDEGTRYRIGTSRGEIDAGRVLLATGCTNEGPFAWWQRRIVPIGSFVIVTAPIDPALLARVLPGRRTYSTSLNIGNYFRLTPDHRLVFGGRARFALSNPTSDARSGRILQQSLAEMFPALAGVPIDYCWGGLVEATADRLPHAGQHQGLYYAAAYSGHGTQMSVYMGDLMADRMLGRERANPWERPWHPVPGYMGTPWFLPLAGAYYRIKDRLS